jgi:hypothetical protein
MTMTIAPPSLDALARQMYVVYVAPVLFAELLLDGALSYTLYLGRSARPGATSMR